MRHSRRERPFYDLTAAASRLSSARRRASRGVKGDGDKESASSPSFSATMNNNCAARCSSHCRRAAPCDCGRRSWPDVRGAPLPMVGTGVGGKGSGG
jgi:hypothetical protein